MINQNIIRIFTLCVLIMPSINTMQLIKTHPSKTVLYGDDSKNFETFCDTHLKQHISTNKYSIPQTPVEKYGPMAAGIIVGTGILGLNAYTQGSFVQTIAKESLAKNFGSLVTSLGSLFALQYIRTKYQDKCPLTRQKNNINCFIKNYYIPWIGAGIINSLLLSKSIYAPLFWASTCSVGVAGLIANCVDQKKDSLETRSFQNYIATDDFSNSYINRMHELTAVLYPFNPDSTDLTCNVNDYDKDKDLLFENAKCTSDEYKELLEHFQYFNPDKVSLLNTQTGYAFNKYRRIIDKGLYASPTCNQDEN